MSKFVPPTGHVFYNAHADYYLLHAMMEGSYTKYDKFHLWNFVQLQINYADWENPSVGARANYDLTDAGNKGNGTFLRAGSYY